MPIFDPDEAIENSEFKRMQNELDAKIIRKRMQKDAETKKLHHSLYPDKDGLEIKLEEALRESQEMYGTWEDTLDNDELEPY